MGDTPPLRSSEQRSPVAYGDDNGCCSILTQPVAVTPPRKPSEEWATASVVDGVGASQRKVPVSLDTVCNRLFHIHAPCVG